MKYETLPYYEIWTTNKVNELLNATACTNASTRHFSTQIYKAIHVYVWLPEMKRRDWTSCGREGKKTWRQHQQPANVTVKLGYGAWVDADSGPQEGLLNVNSRTCTVVNFKLRMILIRGGSKRDRLGKGTFLMLLLLLSTHHQDFI